MDNKYGRLFTAEDVVKLFEHEVHPGFSNVDGEIKLAQLETIIAEFERDGGKLKFPTDEPLFLIRAQDKLAFNIVDEYHWLSTESSRDGDVSEEQVAALTEVRNAFENFSKEHPDKMKFAD